MNKQEETKKNRISRDLMGLSQGIRMDLYTKNGKLQTERIKDAIKEVLK